MGNVDIGDNQREVGELVIQFIREVKNLGATQIMVAVNTQEGIVVNSVGEAHEILGLIELVKIDTKRKLQYHMQSATQKTSIM